MRGGRGGGAAGRRIRAGTAACAAAVKRAARWGFTLDRAGKTFSSTDLLIAAAAHGKATLLHHDADFMRLASAVGIREEFLVEAGKT